MSSVTIRDQVLTYVGGEWEELRVDGGETESLTGLNICKEVPDEVQNSIAHPWRPGGFHRTRIDC